MTRASDYKVLYFTAGIQATTAELAAIAAIEGNVFVRNSSASSTYGSALESCDFVAGTVPSSYSGVPLYTAASSGSSLVGLPTGITTVAAFGDSVTVGQLGSGAAASPNWATQIAAYLGATLTNQGISGTVLQSSNGSGGVPITTSGATGRQRFATALLGANKKDMVFIDYGYNDMRYTGAPSTFNVAAYKVDLQAIVIGLIQGGYPVSRICLMAPYYMSAGGYAVGSAGFTGSNAATNLAYGRAVAEVATEFNTYFFDTYAYMASNGADTLFTGGDLVHPTQTGYNVIATGLQGAKRTSAVGPASFVVSSPAGGQLSLSYTAVAGATSYEVQAGLSGSYIFDTTASTFTTSGTFTGLASGSYFARVRARFADGSRTPWTLSTTATTVSTTANPPSNILPSSLSGAVIGSAYTQTITATTDSSHAISTAVVTGSLPAGLTLSGNVISGTATATAGTYNFTIRVTDTVNGLFTDKAYSIAVTIASAAPVVHSSSTGGVGASGLTVTISTTVATKLYAIIQCTSTAGAASINGVTDSTGLTWTKVDTNQSSAGANFYCQDVWTANAPTALTSAVITATSPGSGDTLKMQAVAVSGTSGVDVVAKANSGTNATTNQTSLSTSLTTTVATDLLILSLRCPSAFGTPTPPAGFTANTFGGTTGGATWIGTATTSSIQSAATEAFSWSTATTGGALTIVALKP